MTDFQITTEDREGTHYVRFAGELDMSCAASAREALVDIAGSTVVADLSGLTFMDSSGLAALEEARAEIERAGHRLELRGARGAVRRVFQLLGMEEWLAD